MAEEAAKQRTLDDEGEATRRSLKAVTGFLADKALSDEERLLYDRIRLGIMSALSVNRRTSFRELKQLLKTSDGNLSRHARKLEDAGYIACHKQFKGRVPKTDFSMTPKGQNAFECHLRHMETLIHATRGE